MFHYIYIQGEKYYYYATYGSYGLALKEAKRYRKKNKSRYFIMKKEGLYKLYMNKTFKIW